MSISIRKNILWALLFLGVGGTCTLVATIGFEGQFRVWPREWIWWIWPVLAILAAGALRRCYRLEPMTQRGFWHLRIEDLLAVSIYVAVLMACTQACMPDVFITVCLPFALLNGIALTIGLLAAARRGFVARRQKFLFGFAFGTTLLGLFSLGALVMVIVLERVLVGEPFRWVRMLLFAKADGFIFWELQLHRLTLLCLPVGLICLGIAAWSRRPSSPATLGSLSK